ncbi:hypothetical protein [Colwellia psychrerythraea]|uniref:Uncharacterized protein n=1 Tax=Colwellia psychrerythraea TaxID=28229 RepID=A0A099KJD1_COLPS|nr:hypothetical protein [Colwellia psychrerythraea]KGJ89678.1 hypothetical protein ND2E_3869 [Colwellia psychrerythraea]
MSKTINIGILLIALFLSNASDAQQFEIVDKPSLESAKLLCENSSKYKAAHFYNIESDSSFNINMKKHSVDLDGDGIDELVTQTFSGTSHQPAIKITSSDNPYRNDPRFPSGVSERHDRVSGNNRYSVALYEGSLFYINFWAGEIDSISAKITKKRNSDGYTFIAKSTLCTFQPLPPPGGSELFLYCALVGSGNPKNKYKSRCTF